MMRPPKRLEATVHDAAAEAPGGATGEFGFGRHGISRVV